MLWLRKLLCKSKEEQQVTIQMYPINQHHSNVVDLGERVQQLFSENCRWQRRTSTRGICSSSLTSWTMWISTTTKRSTIESWMKEQSHASSQMLEISSSTLVSQHSSRRSSWCALWNHIASKQSQISSLRMREARSMKCHGLRIIFSCCCNAEQLSVHLFLLLMCSLTPWPTRLFLLTPLESVYCSGFSTI